MGEVGIGSGRGGKWWGEGGDFWCGKSGGDGRGDGAEVGDAGEIGLEVWGRKGVGLGGGGASGRWGRGKVGNG